MFSLRNPEEFIQQDPKTTNFAFVSIRGIISAGKINGELLDMLDEDVRSAINNQPTGSDECFVQNFSDSMNRSFVLALNEPKNGPQTLDQKCFLFALPFFDNFSNVKAEEFEKSDVPSLTVKVLRRLQQE